MRRIFVLLCTVLLLVNGLPKGKGKKKLTKEEDDDKEIDESSASDESSGEKTNRLEKIGFQQEAVSDEEESTAQVQPVLQKQPVSQTQIQTPLQQYNYKTNNTSAYPTSYQQPSANSSQYANLPSTYYNANFTKTNWPSQASVKLTNSTIGQQQLYSNSNVSKVSNSSVENAEDVKPAKESKVSKKRAEELKCFNKFGESTKEGQTATELVKIYKELHDCLTGKCNYKKAEVSLRKSLKEKTLPGQEVYHKYKCYFNWYELIKKACKPERKEGEEEIEEEEESSKTTEK